MGDVPLGITIGTSYTAIVLVVVAVHPFASVTVSVYVTLPGEVGVPIAAETIGGVGLV